jgi:hypothetical protein
MPENRVSLQELKRMRELLTYFLSYAPGPLPSMEGGEYAENYHEAEALIRSEDR